MKQKIILLILGAAIGIAAVAILQLSKKAKKPAAKSESREYKRIISLAPSTTEILFSLGLGDKVIGVSQYCSYPQEATNRKRFGGLMNINYEAIVAAKADVVIVFEEMLEPENKFAILGIETITVKHNTIEDILESILIIGRKCGAEKQAMTLVANLAMKMQQVEKSDSKNGRPRVLICIGHSISPDADRRLENIYIAGNDGFYSRIIEIVGAENAYGGNVAFPKIGYENLIAINPDIIIDMTIGGEDCGIGNEIFVAQWKKFTDILAVKNNEIHIINEKYMAIPGPRFILTLEKIAETINNENNKP
ncbi:MAG: helical backbone metal receptor [Anaerohalosphaeraceae bacterium]|nr:helical backbone metal receptor [Anaerohalosphaeraceae bacterium]